MLCVCVFVCVCVVSVCLVCLCVTHKEPARSDRLRKSDCSPGVVAAAARFQVARRVLDRVHTEVGERIDERVLSSCEGVRGQELPAWRSENGSAAH